MRLTRFRLSITALAVGITLAAPLTAGAQSLQELYEAARAYDASYLAVRAQTDSAIYRRAQADALRRPSVGLQAQAQRSATDPPDAPGRPDRGYGNVTTGTVSGRQPLYNATNRATIDQAERELQVAEIQLQIAEQDLIVRLSQAYFDVLAAQDTLDTTRASKAATAEQLASAKRNFEVGTATITDTREAQARFDLGTAQEIAADNDLRNKRIALDQLVGRVGVMPKPLLTPVVLPATAPANPEEWVSQADAVHPAIRRAQFGLEVAQIEIEKAKAGHLPTVDLVGSLQYNNNSGVVGVGTGLGTLPGNYKNGSIGIQLNLPLYAGNSVQNRVKETLSLEEKARNDLDAARRGVALNTRVAYNGVQSLLAQVKALEAAESSSKLALESTQLGYRVGVRINLDVLNAQTQLFQTQRDLAKARYDVIVNGLRLRQAAGQLAAGDVEAVNRLLAK
jgi:outer membrane protein